MSKSFPSGISVLTEILAGASMVAYMITHEAHHRGQVCMLAHQLGFPLTTGATSAMWGWEKLWKECGFTHPR